MDLTIKTKDLKDALALASATTDRGRSLVPIVTQVFLSAKGDSLAIRSTDLERMMTSRVSCEVKTDGEVAVNFSRFQGTVNLLSAEDVRIKLNKNGRIEITAGKSKSTIPIDTSIKFPAVESLKGPLIEVSAESLSNAIRQMLPVISAKDGGVIEFSLHPGVMRLAALNLKAGHKFGMTEIACGANVEMAVVVGYESVTAIRKLLTKCDGMAGIRVGSNGMSVSIEGNELHFVRPAIEMPNYMSMIAKERTHCFSIATGEFNDALRRALNFSRGEKDTVAGVKIGAKDKSITLSFSAQDCESEEHVDAEMDVKPELIVNGDYVLSFASEIWNKETQFRFDGSLDPIWVRPNDAQYPLMILMPIRY